MSHFVDQNGFVCPTTNIVHSFILGLTQSRFKISDRPLVILYRILGRKFRLILRIDEKFNINRYCTE